MYVQRATVKSNVSIAGIGLHSGIYTTVELQPAPAGSGITFVRVDLDGLRIPALQASTTALDHATTVGKDDVSVGTVEHLLAALVACGVSDIDILIDAAGVRLLGSDVRVLRIKEPIEISDGVKSIRITPANRLSIKYKIDFDHPVIGRQSVHFDFHHDSFLRKIAPARTFGFFKDVEKMRAAGLARGGSVENAIVLDDRAVMNGPLRFRDEFVRHKVLDLIGDLALVGRPIVGEITAVRGGHALHSRFVEKILAVAEEMEESFEGVTTSEPARSFA